MRSVYSAYLDILPFAIVDHLRLGRVRPLLTRGLEDHGDKPRKIIGCTFLWRFLLFLGTAGIDVCMCALRDSPIPTRLTGFSLLWLVNCERLQQTANIAFEPENAMCISTGSARARI